MIRLGFLLNRVRMRSDALGFGFSPLFVVGAASWFGLGASSGMVDADVSGHGAQVACALAPGQSACGAVLPC